MLLEYPPLIPPFIAMRLQAKKMINRHSEKNMSLRFVLLIDIIAYTSWSITDVGLGMIDDRQCINITDLRNAVKNLPAGVQSWSFCDQVVCDINIINDKDWLT